MATGSTPRSEVVGRRGDPDGGVDLNFRADVAPTIIKDNVVTDPGSGLDHAAFAQNGSLIRSVPREPTDRVIAVFNWFEDLKRKAPVAPE